MTTTNKNGDDQTNNVNIIREDSKDKDGKSTIINMEKPLNINDSHIKINIQDWGQYMENLMSSLKGDPTHHFIVYSAIPSFHLSKAPRQFSEVKPEAFKPKEVTIGPFHATLEHNRTNNLKANTLNEYMSRCKILSIEKLFLEVEDVLQKMFEWDYSAGFPKTVAHTQWVKHVLITDTVFIIGYLERLSRTKIWDGKIPRQVHQSTFLRAQQDFLLMGNQIPMDLIETVSRRLKIFEGDDFEKVVRKFSVCHNPFFCNRDSRISFIKFLDSIEENLSLGSQTLLHSVYLACTLADKPHSPGSSIEGRFSEDSVSEFEEASTESRNVRFCRLRKLLGCGTMEKPTTTAEEFVRLPTASEIVRSGISFQACEGNLSVIKYDKRTRRLHLPKIAIHDRTEAVLRNLIALEVAANLGSEFWMYGVIMEQLILTKDDLAILEKAKVIENHLGPGEESVNMWKNMCIDKSYYDVHTQAMVNDIVDDYSSRCNLWRVEFHDRFLARPWYTASAITALLLLIASIFQTVFTVLAYLTPKI